MIKGPSNNSYHLNRLSTNKYPTSDDAIQRYRLLLELGQMITSEMNLDALFKIITDQINQIMDAERSSVFMYDAQNDQLWSLVATELKKNEIRLPRRFGVAGWVFEQRKPAIINDAYSDPRFCQDVDKKTGYRTRNILCIPVLNRRQECIGILQALNKRRGDFTLDDQDLLYAASNYVAIALENAKLYEDLKLLDRARERVMHHLSHELKTPLAIISGVVGIIRKKAVSDGLLKVERPLRRLERSVERLMDLQVKIDDILNNDSVVDKQRILDVVENAAGVIDLFAREKDFGQYGELLQMIADRLDTLFHFDTIHPEKIRLDAFLRDVCHQAAAQMDFRELKLQRTCDEEATLMFDRTILGKVCMGLLKNAIENTPDQGIVRVSAKLATGGVRISFHDQGVGITAENQKMIFGGFFHTLDTNAYSTKKPFEFNAGGSGSDLLRIKIFSERTKFDIDFSSSRCVYIPRDQDLCPGRISTCPHISSHLECRKSGFSTFTLLFPRP